MAPHQWIVKKGRALHDKKGNVIGRPGDKFAWDDENALREPSAVRAHNEDDLPGQTTIEDHIEVMDPLPPPEEGCEDDEE